MNSILHKLYLGIQVKKDRCGQEVTFSLMCASKFFSIFILSNNLYTSILTEPITTVIRFFYTFKIIYSPNM